jgi:hypothetical protein
MSYTCITITITTIVKKLRAVKCYQKRLDDKKKLEEYQFKVDLDLARKENLIRINDMIQDPRIDNYNDY